MVQALHVLTEKKEDVLGYTRPFKAGMETRELCLQQASPAETCDYSIASIKLLDFNHYYFSTATGFFATTVFMEGLHREHIQTPGSAK